MRYEFRYQRLRGATFPTVPVELRTRTAAADTTALVDSGASIRLFDGTIARALAICIRTRRRIDPTGIGGTITAYVHHVTLRIGDTEFDADVAFTTRRKLPLNLLGARASSSTSS